jgi:hypothetical protein
MEWLLIYVCLAGSKYNYICGVNAERWPTKASCEERIDEYYGRANATCTPVAPLSFDAHVQLNLPIRKPTRPCHNSSQSQSCR